jgi:hypothetical protein
MNFLVPSQQVIILHEKADCMRSQWGSVCFFVSFRSLSVGFGTKFPVGLGSDFVIFF